MTTAPYVYRLIAPRRVIDADTIHGTLDVGFHLTATVHIRVAGVDGPELNQGSPYERRKGREARDFTANWFLQPGEYWVRTEPDPDSFGRWIGQVWRETGSPFPDVLAADLLAAADSLAAPWPQRWWQRFDKDRNKPADWGMA